MAMLPPPGSQDGMLRSPTFFVGAEKQRKNLEEFQRREQQLAERYHKTKPLCFNARAYQKPHPIKAQKGHKDADATLVSPMILGVADGVSQIEDFGIDASMLPNELLKMCEELAMYQLIPDTTVASQDAYRGPIPLLRRAFEATESLGSLTVVLAIMDNSTRIHGKLHPMVAIITIGDCELLILRRVQGRMGALQAVCHTEMQRIDGHAQTPLQLARVDARIDPDFYEGITIEVIEKGSAVHCVSAYEGDIVIMGSDGVFDNLFLDEISDLCNSVLPPGQQGPTHESLLGHLAQCIVKACHAKTKPSANGQMPEAPIGKGGKKDDTSCVVAEVVEWTDEHSKRWAPRRRPWGWEWHNPFANFVGFDDCCAASYDSDYEFDPRTPDTIPVGATSGKSPGNAPKAGGMGHWQPYDVGKGNFGAGPPPPWGGPPAAGPPPWGGPQGGPGWGPPGAPPSYAPQGYGYGQGHPPGGPSPRMWGGGPPPPFGAAPWQHTHPRLM